MRGSDQYFQGVAAKIKSLGLFLSMQKGADGSSQPSFPVAFHTGSCAENHWPHLRRVLADYAAAVTGDANAKDRVLNDDAEFRRAARDYAAVTTHYFAQRTEEWYKVVLRKIADVTDYIYRHEFAKSRGQIHAHGVEYSSTALWAARLRDTMRQLANSVAQEIHDRVDDTHDSDDSDDDRGAGGDGDSVHSSDNDNDDDVREQTREAAERVRRLYQPGTMVFTEEVSAALDKVERRHAHSVQQVLHSYFAHDAVHPGLMPAEVRQPEGTLTAETLADARPLQRLKMDHEHDQPQCTALQYNIQSLHACSLDYCLKVERIWVPEELLPPTAPDGPTRMHGPRGQPKVKERLVTVMVCRFGNGYAKFPAVNGVCTGDGRFPTRVATFAKMAGGQARFEPMRNHRRSVPSNVLHRIGGCNMCVLSLSAVVVVVDVAVVVAAAAVIGGVGGVVGGGGGVVCCCCCGGGDGGGGPHRRRVYVGDWCLPQGHAVLLLRRGRHVPEASHRAGDRRPGGRRVRRSDGGHPRIRWWVHDKGGQAHSHAPPHSGRGRPRGRRPTPRRVSPRRRVAGSSQHAVEYVHRAPRGLLFAGRREAVGVQPSVSSGLSEYAAPRRCRR